MSKTQEKRNSIQKDLKNLFIWIFIALINCSGTLKTTILFFNFERFDFDLIFVVSFSRRILSCIWWVGSIEPDGIHLGSITCHRIIKAIDIQIKRFFKSFRIEFLFCWVVDMLYLIQLWGKIPMHLYKLWHFLLNAKIFLEVYNF